MTKGSLYRLSDSTVIEPLVDHWYAWSFLISPIPASLHLLNYQITTMRSYLDDPDIHVKACRDPELIGGPFMDIPVERADEVRRLLATTEQKRGEQIELAKTVIAFHNWLVDEAKGQSLEPYYRKVPDMLRGYVELVYDYYNRPTARFLESLLYESKYYDKGLQSLKIARLERDNSRPFFISTPRFADEGDVNWELSFDDPRVDELFSLDVTPQPLGRVREVLAAGAEDDKLLLPLLSDEISAPPERWRQKTVRIRYIGHACVLMEWNGISILTDPYIGVRPSGGGMPRLSYRDLPERIDYALVTHNHQDHCVLETLLRLRNRVECLVFPKPLRVLYGDVSLKLMAQKIGFKRVIELDSLESIPLPDGEIIAIPFMGEHGDFAHSKTGYVVRAGREQVLFGADSDCLEGRVYENIRGALGRIETVFLGTESVGAPLGWICGPLLPRKIDHNIEQTRRYHGANAETALDLIEAVGATRVYNYAMGMEPWLDHLLGLCLSETSPQIEESNKLLARARGRGLLAAERLFGTRDIYIETGRRASVAAGFKSVIEDDELSPEQAPSIFQQRLLSLSRRELESHLYEVSASFTLAGRLNVEALEQSLNEVVRRHKILKTRLVFGEGRKRKIVSQEPGINLRIVDRSPLPEGERSAEAICRADKGAGRLLGLEHGALLDAVLVRLAPEEHVLLVAAHRIIADSQSLQILSDELSVIYDAFSSGVASPLEELPLQYADFASGQRRGIEEGAFDYQFAYWKQQLADRPPASGLPADMPRVEGKTFHPDRQTFSLSEDLSRSARELSSREHRPLSTLLLSAFQVLLHRYAGQDDILVGAVSDGRGHPETEALIGPFANVLAIRADLSGDPNFLALMARTSEVVARAFEHQDLPFELLMKSMQAEWSADPSPPLRSIFTFNQAQTVPLTPAGLMLSQSDRAGAEPLCGQGAQCDMVMSLTDQGRVISGAIEYNPDLFATETVAVAIESFKNLLEGIVASPESRLSSTAPLREGLIGLAHAASGFQNTSDAEDQFIF